MITLFEGTNIMRKTAYIQAIEEAFILPTAIPKLKQYFQDPYSPRDRAIQHILRRARLDIEGLYDSEFIDVYNTSALMEQK